MKLNDTKTQFNCVRCLNISNINAEILKSHPSTQYSGKMKTSKNSLPSLGLICQEQKSVQKLTTTEQKEQTANFLRGFDDVEVGFVDGLFELYKLRELIAKYQAEIIST